MPTIAESIYANAEIGKDCALSRSGTSLENPFVFDATARELRDMAQLGLVEVVRLATAGSDCETLITSLHFRRLR